MLLAANIMRSLQHFGDSVIATLGAATAAMLGALESCNEFMEAKTAQVEALSVSMATLAKRIDEISALCDWLLGRALSCFVVLSCW